MENGKSTITDCTNPQRKPLRRDGVQCGVGKGQDSKEAI